MKYQWAAWLAVVMLAAGACCCRGEIAASIVKAEHGCCAEGAKTTKASDYCSCAGKVLIEAKVGKGNVGVAAWLSHFQAFEFFNVDSAHAPERVSVRLWAMSHAPPPVHRQRLLQVWLI